MLRLKLLENVGAMMRVVAEASSVLGAAWDLVSTYTWANNPSHT